MHLLTRLAPLVVLLACAQANAQVVTPLFTGHEIAFRGPVADVALADVNGDGILDLLTANPAAGTVSVRLGDGMGGFSGTTEVAAGSQPCSISAADLNMDGLMDFVVANRNTAALSLLFGDGTGHFSAPTQQPSTSQTVNPGWVVALDFNHDGRPEIFNTCFSQDLTKQYVSALSLPAPAPTTQNYSALYTVNGPLQHFAVGNLDNWEAQDLVATGGRKFEVNLISGWNNNMTIPLSVPTPGTLSSVAIADVNGDGKNDLVGAQLDRNSVVICPAASFWGYGPAREIPVSGSPSSVAVADLNGDRLPDLLTANPTAGTVSIRLQNKAGDFEAGGDLSIPSATIVKVADLNGDGLPDFVTTNGADNTVSVRLNTLRVSSLQARYAIPFTYYGSISQLTWKRGNGLHRAVFVREVRPGRAPITPPHNGVVYPGGAQEMSAEYLVGPGTYLLDNRENTLADTLAYLRNGRLGHVYEVAVYEYTVDPVIGPVYRPEAADYHTFTVGRFAPELTASLRPDNRPFLSWTTEAQYLARSFQVQQSLDGVTFTDMGAPVAGLDSSITRTTATLTAPLPLTAAATYRVVLTHADGTVLVSNLRQLTPRPLPVQLTSFSGSVQSNSTALLRWQTATELNSAYFEIERSDNGRQFEPIGRVTAAGSASTAQTYQFPDSRPLPALTYYRLRQVDLDGQQHYSSILTLAPRAQGTELVLIPNPVTAARTVNLQLRGLPALPAAATLRVRSAVSSQLLLEQQFSPAAGGLDLSTAGLAPGLYLVEVQAPAGRWYARLLVQ